MTKIWTLSTGGTGVFRLESYRRKPGGRRPGNPVSRRATKNRFFVHIPPHFATSSTPRVPLQFFSLRIVAPRAECKRAFNISPILSHLLSLRIDRRRFLPSNFVATNCWNRTSISEKVTFLETRLSFDSDPCSFFSIFSDRSCFRYENTKIVLLFRVLIFNLVENWKDWYSIVNLSLESPICHTFTRCFISS